MRYQILEAFRIRTSQGEKELQPGQLITLSQDKAIGLIEKGKITPIGRVAYKVYSEVLQVYLWVVADDRDIRSLRTTGVNEAIYTGNEIETLRGKDKDSLRAIQKVKQAFDDSKVNE